MRDDAPALVLDCRGKRCPLPIIELARNIGEVAVGQTVWVMADDPAAASDVPAWCRMRGHQYIRQAACGFADEPDSPAFVVRRLY